MNLTTHFSPRAPPPPPSSSPARPVTTNSTRSTIRQVAPSPEPEEEPEREKEAEIEKEKTPVWYGDSWRKGDDSRYAGGEGTGKSKRRGKGGEAENNPPDNWPLPLLTTNKPTSQKQHPRTTTPDNTPPTTDPPYPDTPTPVPRTQQRTAFHPLSTTTAPSHPPRIPRRPVPSAVFNAQHTPLPTEAAPALTSTSTPPPARPRTSSSPAAGTPTTPGSIFHTPGRDELERKKALVEADEGPFGGVRDVEGLRRERREVSDGSRSAGEGVVEEGEGEGEGVKTKRRGCFGRECRVM